MAWTNYQKFLALLMLITGSINTLSTKWADELYSVGVDGKTARKFNHPFFQASGMFLGEFFCMVAYFIHRYCTAAENREERQKFNPLIFLPASLCDMTGTSLMYIALTMTNAASFQMLRGAIIIFTALLSVAFLRRTIKSYMWGGMLSIVLGLVMVGLGDFLYGSTTNANQNGVITGDELIVIAQVIVAVQMCYEERFISRYNVPPLMAVGWEGFFGFVILVLLQIPMYYIQVGTFRGDPEGRIENAIDAFVQLGNNWQLLLAMLGNILSIAFFNFAGISVTKEMNATTRMVLDSLRTLVIWVVSLSLSWQAFYVIQVFGFIFLCIGMCLYNDIVIRPLFIRFGYCVTAGDDELLHTISTPSENEPLLQENDDNPKRYSVQEGSDEMFYRTGARLNAQLHSTPPSA